MTDFLFENNEQIRTLGFYQPFCTLMELGKVETRWVRKGKKPPFPLVNYLFYSTIKRCQEFELYNWCGTEICLNINNTLVDSVDRQLNKSALSTGTLVKIRLMTKEDEVKAFVKFFGERTVIKKGIEVVECQWCLEFENVKRLEPFEWNFGKQGVGFVPQSEIQKIKIIQ